MRPSAAIPVIAIALAAAPPAIADIVDLLAASDAAVEVLGNDGGLAGYHVTPAGEDESYTLYVTPEGYAVVGLLYDGEGLLVTADQLARLAAPPPPTLSPPVDPLAAGGFVLGTTGPPVLVYADPACPFSRSTVARLAGAALERRLVLEVVPVALLGAESAALALGAADAEAWFERRTAEPEHENTARVRANNARFRAVGGTAVPLLVWQDASGARQSMTGAVDDVAGFLRRLGP